MQVAMEAAAKEVTELQDASAGGARGDMLMVTANCYRSGKSNHKAPSCPFKRLRCHNCGKVGHVRNICRLPKKNFKSTPSDKKPNHPMKAVVEVTDTET